MGELTRVCKVVCDGWIKCSCTNVKYLEQGGYSQHLLCCHKIPVDWAANESLSSLLGMFYSAHTALFTGM